MFSLVLGVLTSIVPHDATDFGEGSSEFAPTLSAGPSHDLEPRLETWLGDRVAGVSECNAGIISMLVLCPGCSDGHSNL